MLIWRIWLTGVLSSVSQQCQAILGHACMPCWLHTTKKLWDLKMLPPPRLKLGWELSSNPFLPGSSRNLWLLCHTSFLDEKTIFKAFILYVALRCRESYFSSFSNMHTPGKLCAHAHTGTYTHIHVSKPSSAAARGQLCTWQSQEDPGQKLDTNKTCTPMRPRKMKTGIKQGLLNYTCWSPRSTAQVFTAL